MVRKPPQSQNSPEDRDAWESLAEDLFGVDLHKKPPEPVEDDLLLDPVVPPAAQSEPEQEDVVEEVIEFADITRTPTDEEVAAATADAQASEDDIDDDDDDDDIIEFKPAVSKSPDDFWAALEQFAPEELATPIVPDKEVQRKADQKKIGPRPLVSGPVTNVPVKKDEFVEDAEFGVGVLDNIDTGESQEDTSDNVGDSEGDSDESKPEKTGRRRSRRRRRGRKKPGAKAAESDKSTASDADSAADEDELEFVETVAGSQPVESQTSIPADDDDADEGDEDLSAESDDEDGEGEVRPRYKNVPTWAQAISYLKRKSDPPRGESTSTAPAEKKPGRRRSRGGGRRRRKPSDSSRPQGEAEGSSAPASPPAPPESSGE